MSVNSIDPMASQFFGATPVKQKSALDMTTFIRLLTVQLANQNPLEPMSDRDFFAQMAQLGQVQGTDKMTKQLQTLQASTLIGKTVRATITRAEGAPAEEIIGRVIGMDVKNGEQILKVQEADGGLVDVKFDNITSFTDIQVQQIPTPTLSDASQLIGRNIKFWENQESDGTLVEGQVVRASMVNGVAMLTVRTPAGEVQVRYDSVREVLS